jgi:hypothetical protein
LLCTPGWPWTHDSPVSASWVLWLQVRATTSGIFLFLITCTSCTY